MCGQLCKAGSLAAAQVRTPSDEQPEKTPAALAGAASWISDDGFRNATLDGKTGFQLKARMIGYRGMPLTCLRKVELKIDGRPVDTGGAILVLDNRHYGFTDFSHGGGSWRDVPWWYVLDEATLFVPSPAPLASGQHRVEGTLTVRMIFATAGRMDRSANAVKDIVLESD